MYRSLKRSRWVAVGVLIGMIGLLSACTPERFILARLVDDVPVFMVCDPAQASTIEIGTALSDNQDFDVRWVVNGDHSFHAGDSFALGEPIEGMEGDPPRTVDLDLDLRVAIREPGESGGIATNVAEFRGGQINEDGWITQTRNLGDAADPCAAAKG